MTGSDIQRLVAAEDAVLIEGNAAGACEISLDVGPRRDAVVQLHQLRDRALEPLHALRESIAQAFHDLEQRQVDVSRAAPGGERAAAVAHQALEIAEIF